MRSFFCAKNKRSVWKNQRCADVYRKTSDNEQTREGDEPKEGLPK